MPDIICVFEKRWKLILGLTLTAIVLSLAISLLKTKEYLSTVTALPANSVTADKSRIFNPNIEALYPEVGSPDELDRIEGTSKLDTLYIAVADSLKLAAHYNIDENSKASTSKAAAQLRKKTEIQRSAYGELKIRVWDTDPFWAAQIANAIFNKLNAIHQDIQNANNETVLRKLRQEVMAKQKESDSINMSVVDFRTSNADDEKSSIVLRDTIRLRSNFGQVSSRIASLNEQLKEYNRLISQYELAININPNVLIAVEKARPALAHDKPKTFQNVLFAFGAALIFSFLLALFTESRSARA